MPPIGGFLRLLATRPGRLDQPPGDDAPDVSARDRILRPVERGQQRSLHQIAGAGLGGGDGFDLHDPFGKFARCDRLSGFAQGVVDQPQAFAAAKPGVAHVAPPRPDLGQPDCGIEQPQSRIQMRQIGLLARQLPLELADHPRQFSPFVA